MVAAAGIFFLAIFIGAGLLALAIFWFARRRKRRRD